ncbi:MAG: hypothetical protein ABF293_13000 [Flavobacteriaceae bacterium]
MTNSSRANNLIDKILQSAPKVMDLTDEFHARLVIDAADQILASEPEFGEITQLEERFLKSTDGDSIFILLVLKIVRSKLLVRKIKDTLSVSVVFAVYKEHNRIKKKSEHPHGEDFLTKKVEQLRWLFSDKTNIDWKLIVVDDGCPDSSGAIARDIAIREQLTEEVRVLFLADALEKNIGPVGSLSSTSESQKGGSIVYGMWDAVEAMGSEDHIVIYTDADLSTHLGQVGLLLDPILNEEKLAAIGSRRETDSVVVKTGSRNSRGKLFIYLWKRLLADLGDIVDTQCGFKAFKAEIVDEIVDGILEKKFAFDIELLLRTILIRDSSIARVGIAWIDSEAASTTTDLSPYLPMLKSIVKMYRKYVPAQEESDRFAAFIDSLNETEFMVLLDSIPEAILEREPYEFTHYKGVKAEDLKKCINR